MITHFILAIAFGFSAAVLLVEKGDDWPITLLSRPLRFIFGKIYNKLSQMLECTVCMSFWTTLVGELILKFFITSQFYWPFTGILALGATWLIIELLNALDNKKSV